MRQYRPSQCITKIPNGAGTEPGADYESVFNHCSMCLHDDDCSQIALLALDFSQGESGVSYGQGGGGGGAKTEKVEIHILGEQYAQENNTTLGMEIPNRA